MQQCQNKALKFGCTNSVATQKFSFEWQQEETKTFGIPAGEKKKKIIILRTILFTYIMVLF